MNSGWEKNAISEFCKATSTQSRSSALFHLEAFGWDLDEAISGFKQGRRPPLKDRRLRSRSPSRRDAIFSNLRSFIKSLDTSEETLTLENSDDLSNGGEKFVSMPDHEVKEEGSVLGAANESTIEIDLPFPDLDSDSD